MLLAHPLTLIENAGTAAHSPAPGAERYREVTFDRELAIRNSVADFLAIGHPFVDAALSYVGSYDFGGLTAIRYINEPALAGRSGFLFVFILRQRVPRENGDECLFSFTPLFVNAKREIDDGAVWPAVSRSANEGSEISKSVPGVEAAFNRAQEHIRDKHGIWDWIDDVEFLSLSWVQFT